MINKREVIALYNFMSTMQVSDLSLTTEEWKILSDNREKLSDAIKVIDDERRELVRQFAGKTKKGEIAKVPDESIDLYQKEYIDMMQSELDIEFKTIGLENLGDKMNSEVGIWEFMKYIVSK